MIGPEQGKKTSGKSGKKKNKDKAKKAKRLAAQIDLIAPPAPDGDRPPVADAPAAPSAGPPVEPATATVMAGAVPEVGPPLLAWIDRVQERVDYLLTLVDPAVGEPASGDSEVGEPASPLAEVDEPEVGEPASPLAEAWAHREESVHVPPIEDDEPFEAEDARLTAVLVARELLSRGESRPDVRRRLREGYGVADPDAVLAQIAA